MRSADTALIVVDVQRDYLDRPGLAPPEDVLVAAVARTLGAFRSAGAPVAHVHTVVRADGADALPHWRERGLACVEGTAGARPPAAAAPAAGEHVARKQQYRGLVDAGLHQWLRERRIRCVVLAGLHEHACVRETALDAVEAGYEVVIARDAVGSDRPEDAALTREWLSERVVQYVDHDALVAQLSDGAAEAWPPDLVHVAAGRAAEGQRAWATRGMVERADAIDAWAAVCEQRAEALASEIVAEVAKPISAARDEVRRAVGHIRTAARLARDPVLSSQTVAAGATVVRVPIGVVGLLMPWNNPLALPVGKIAPALAFGNAVVFKPAPEGEATARALLATLAEAGIPAGLVEMVTGGIDLGMRVVREPLVTAIALTGSVAAGRAVGAECARLGKPIQGELGGNNAAVVLADADLHRDVPLLVRGAFAYGGQRCTAVRRLVVEEAALPRALELVREAMDRIVVGVPADDATEVGPLVSLAARERVARVVDAAIADGVELVHRTTMPPALPDGAWYPLTLLLTRDPAQPVVQEETFGPVLVVQPARDIDDAIVLANGVPHGLLMAVCTSSSDSERRVVDAARAGIVQIGAAPPAIHPDAPFGGWKASGIGPPEHGVWDVDFHTRVQVRYGAP